VPPRFAAKARDSLLWRLEMLREAWRCKRISADTSFWSSAAFRSIPQWHRDLCGTVAVAVAAAQPTMGHLTQSKWHVCCQPGPVRFVPRICRCQDHIPGPAPRTAAV